MKLSAKGTKRQKQIIDNLKKKKPLSELLADKDKGTGAKHTTSKTLVETSEPLRPWDKPQKREPWHIFDPETQTWAQVCGFMQELTLMDYSPIEKDKDKKVRKPAKPKKSEK